MSRRPAPKRIHYVRAVYGQGPAPAASFEILVRRAINRLGSMAATQIAMSNLGIVAVRQRRLESPLYLAIGAGAPNEAMSTMGIGVVAVADADVTEAPPAARAFKHADAYVLIEGNDLLLVVDGGVRIESVETYLRLLLQKDRANPRTAPFSFRKASNLEKERVIAQEGIKEMKLEGTFYAATRELQGGQEVGGLAGGWRSFANGIKTLFEEEQTDDHQRQLLAERWADLNMTTTIKAEGGSRAQEVVLDSMEAVGRDLLAEVPDGVEVTVTTRNNTIIRGSELVLVKNISLHRRDNTNDLATDEVWGKLGLYRLELQAKGAWQR